MVSSLVQTPLLDTVETRLEAEELFDRQRKQTRTRALGILLYHLGLSCRTVSRWLDHHEEYVCPATVSNWYRRAGELFRERPIRRHREIAVDETTIHLENDQGELEEFFLWVAIDVHTSEIVHVAVTDGRTPLDALAFLRGSLRWCETEPFVHVDRGSWYPWPLELLDVEWQVTRGGVRNRVETWFGEIKRRLEAFRRRFPWTASQASIASWCRAFAFVGNRQPSRTV